MSVTGVIQSGLTGLLASQQGLRVTGQNVSNVNTPGYARADIQLTSNAGVAGVEVDSVRRAADRFLTAAGLNADAARKSAEARAEFLDRAQSGFGDPAEESSVFGSIDKTFAAFTLLGADPASGLRLNRALGEVEALLNDIGRIGGDLEQLRLEADQRLRASVDELNGLLRQVSELNREIERAHGANSDTTGAQNAQAILLDKVGALVDLRVTPRPLGGVELRTQSGVSLVGDRPAQFVARGQDLSAIEVDEGGGASRPLHGELRAGLLEGLLTARDRDIPALQEALGGLAGALADTLNAAHNDNAAYPPPNELAGRETGLLGTDALRFTGKSAIGIVDTAGVLLRRIEVDFSAATISINGAGPVAYAASGAAATVDQLVAALDQAFNGAVTPAMADLGDVTFADGRLTLSTSGSAAGLVVQQDRVDPANRAGRGFGHFFGLNDLVTRPDPAFYEHGLTSTDAGFTGGAVTLRIRDQTGAIIAEPRLDPNLPAGAPIGATIGSFVTAMNAAVTGLGPFARVSAPDSQNGGRVSLTVGAGFSVEVVSDDTTRGGVPMSELFGIGQGVGARRAVELRIRPDIASNANRLSVGRPDLSVTGQRVIERGDGRGMQALANAKDIVRAQAPAGALTGQNASLTQFAAALGGEVGRRASDAARSRDSAETLMTAAFERRSAKEGVQLDEELVKMTRFQQSYSAAARLIQAGQEMWDVLLRL